MRQNKHDNKHLQVSWNKYGEDAFLFYIIEECNIEKLNDKETEYILNLNTINSNYGYNLQCGGGVSHIIREDTQQKLREAGAKSHINYVPNSNIKSSMFGKRLSDEAKEKIRNARLGIKASEETRKKLSESRKGAKNPRAFAIYCPELNEEFWGAKEVQDKYGFNKNHISSCIHNKRKHCGIHPITGEKLTWVKVEK